jgi:hypothetical protein
LLQRSVFLDFGVPAQGQRLPDILGQRRVH